MAIKLLNEHLINQIAAGEVIERPASVVKELVENAIDAGSTRISVKIAGGGLEMIEVEDNGSGIPPQDVALALQRHATSKIAVQSDLFTISTMGFRGEALPSIASIAHMTIYTRQKDADGVEVQIEGGIIRSQLPFAGAKGTRIVVRELFFNTPVRRKFIKSPVSEQNHIYEIISRLALSRPDISFMLSSEKKLYFKTPGNGSLRDALISINGKDYADQFIDFRVNGEQYSVGGLLSKPEFHRINRKNQIFYVNNRLIKSPMLNRAVDEGYRGLLLAREYPGVVIFISLNYGEVDINVHPQKSELRFRDEGDIFRMVSHAIKDAVNGLAYTMGEDAWKSKASVDYNGNARNFIQPSRVHDQTISFDYPPQERTVTPGQQAAALNELDNQSAYRLIGQCFNSYLLVEMEGKLWLLDQHAAHERIMYNHLRQQIQGASTASQLLALPLILELSAAQLDMIEKNQQIFTDIGLQFDIMGTDSIVIRSAPPSLIGQESQLLMELLEMLGESHNRDYHDEALCMMACKQAVKAGQILSRMEMENIIEELLQEDDYQHCPHGRPTFMEISHSDLDRRFKR